jgi:hypothetical protein
MAIDCGNFFTCSAESKGIMSLSVNDWFAMNNLFSKFFCWSRFDIAWRIAGLGFEVRVWHFVR